MVGGEGVSLVDQVVTTVLWEDVCGLEYTPHGIALHGVEGVSLELQSSWFAKGQEAFALIHDRVDDALIYRADTARAPGLDHYPFG